MVTKYVFEQEFILDNGRSDGGRSQMGDVTWSPAVGEDHPLFVRIMSWDETKVHKAIRTLNGRRVRVTIEVLP